MTPFEKIFQMTSKLGLSTLSKRAPHGRWRIDIWLPNGASITADSKRGTCDLMICQVSADTPGQAAAEALHRLEARLAELSEQIDTIRRGTT